MQTQSQNPPIILVVKDDHAVLQLIVDLLEPEGYKVFAAESARRALELTATVRADLILSDIVMPEMTGLELCQKLKTHPETAAVPVMLVSAVRKEDAARLEGYSAGADEYLEIPFRPEELLIKVARLVERHRSQRVLQKSEEEYRLLFKANPCPMWLCDQETLQFLAVNDAAVHHYGYTREEFLAMSAKQIRAPDAVPALLDHLANTPGAHANAGVWQHRKKHGAVIDVDVTWHKVEFGGRPSFLVLANDVTEKKRSEMVVRESEQRFREIFDNANDIIYTHDLKGNFISLNQAGEQLTGYLKAEVAGLNFADVVVPEQVELARGMLARKIENDELATVYELEIVSKVGRRLTLELSTRLMYRDGEPVGVQGIARDISERKRAEAELRRRNQELAALNEIGQELSKLVEPAEIAQLIHTMIGKVMDNRNLYVALYDAENEEVSFPAYTIDGKAYHSPTRKLGLGLTEYVIRTKKPLLIPRDVDGALQKLGLQLSGRSAQCWLAVPMLVGQNIVGVITIQDYERPESYDLAHLELLLTIASQAAIVVENARLYGAMKQHADRTALTNRISQGIRQTLDVSEVFHTAVRELGTHLNVDRCSLFMKDELAGRVKNVAEYHRPDVGPAAHDFDTGLVEGLNAAMEQHGVLAFDDVTNDERIRGLYEHLLKNFDVRSIMYIGVTVGDELMGAFALSTTRDVRHWTSADIEVAKSVADQTGIAIRQARLYQKSEATSTREALVNKLGGAIRSSLSLPQVLDTTARELGQALSVSRVQVRLCDGTNENLFVKIEYAINSQTGGQFDGYYDQLLREHFKTSAEPLVIGDIENYAELSAQLAEGIRFHGKECDLRSTIISPLTVNQKFRGVICIEQAERARWWSEDEVLLVESVASQLATGIAQAELFEIVARAKKEWETTFDTMSDGVFIFDPQGRLIRVNKAGAAMDNEAPQTILGRKCCEILRADAADTGCIVERSLSQAQSVNVEVVPYYLNRPVLVTVEPLFDSSKQIVGAVCTARDLSELRKVEAVARERQSLLKSILESARESIYALDREGSYQWCNQAMLELTGFTMNELIGGNFLEHVHEADREMCRARFATALAGEAQRFESRYVARDGAVRYALVNTAPIVVDGETTGVLGIAHDITEQKQERESAARADKLRALGQLASGVAHDFNNSLAAILGRAQLILRRVHDDELIRSLGVIVTAAEDAASTVRRIQTFARKSSAAEMESLDLGNLLRDAIEITRTRWQNEARAAGQNIEVLLNADAGSLTRGNASELREVFVNLIVNAVDAMPKGGNVTISCKRNGAQIQLRFADTGTGMEEEVRERVFEPFYTTKGVHGTGLGLAVSYGIIERHNGTISVSSKRGQGTSFHIELPLDDSYDQAAKDAPVDLPARSSALSVLVVDDEAVVRETLAEMLAELDHKVVTAESGRDALEKVSSVVFDLVFTDLAMPEMDGWETARAIRRQRPELPVVLVTGYGATARPPSGESDLVAGIIGKPFDFDQVTGTIARVVAQ